LVTGAAGQLGRELMGLLGDQAVPLDLPEHDLTDHDATRKLILRFRPSAVKEPALCDLLVTLRPPRFRS
jgi:dTDP-4-dehydrorhamnose reductase